MRFETKWDPDSNSYVLHDRGEALQEKSAPTVWAVFPVLHAPLGRTNAANRAHFVTGLLNGVRDRSEQIDIY